MNNTVYIYGLCSSENGTIRYVGKTRNNLKNRLNEHKYDALTKKRKNHKCNWIRKIYREGFELQIVLIEEVNENNWEDREIFWISYYREHSNAVNQLDGGNNGGIGGKVYPYSYEETKELLKSTGVDFKSYAHYKKYVKEKGLRKMFPLCPKKVFLERGEWVSWGDFFSNNYISEKEMTDKYLPYNELKNEVINLGVKSRSEYRKIARERETFPIYPDVSYKGRGWENWYEFLGLKKCIKCSYDTFCRYISLYFGKLPPMKRYNRLLTNKVLSNRLPYHPERTYKRKLSEIRKDIKEIKFKQQIKNGKKQT